MRKLILTFRLLLVTSCTVTIMFAVENLWGNSLNIHCKETNNENNHLKEEITTYISSKWTGDTSTDWNTSSNWDPEVVPGSASDVTIPYGGKQPVISAAAECHNITIQTYATLTIMGTYTLRVMGNWTNNGTFTSQTGTVSFYGEDQVIGYGLFKNLTIGGSGVKTIGTVQVTGILSIESSAILSDKINYTATSILEYNCTEPRTIGKEWPTVLEFLKFIGGINIKNTGIISLNSTKILDATPISILEGATLNLDDFDLTVSGNINLQCGGNIAGSLIKGSGKLILNGDVIVSNSGKGTKAAVIECPVKVLPCTFDVSDGNLNSSDPIDLWINTLEVAGTLEKTGIGTMSIRGLTTLTSYLRIYNGNIIIQPTGSVTCGRLVNEVGPTGLCLLSNANSTGSLIVSFQDIGKNEAIVKRYLTPGAWHLVSAPLSGQNIGDFLSNNNAIPTPVDATDPRAMRDYDSANNQWAEFFSSASTKLLSMGKGYCMRVKNSSTHEVIFTGTIQIEQQTVGSLSAGNWNCIGNPYTSAININVSALNGENFFSVNAAETNPNIDPAYGIYIWDAPDAFNGQTGYYTAISNVPTLGASYAVQQGQGFMVKMAPLKTSVSFTKAMQVHDNSLTLKSTNDIWPMIQLQATTDSANCSTVIAFHEGMTKGLDPTYDAGLLKSGGSMELYTRLVKDYGIPFAIQALPPDQYDQLIIPVGLDQSKGGQVTFSAKCFYLPSLCRPILEDRLTGIVTDLANKTYTTDLMANTIGTGRFYLHTSYTTTRIGNYNNKYILSARFINQRQLRIQGIPINNATVSLTDALGRLIITQQLKENDNNTITVPNIKPGMYVLSVSNSEFTQAMKLVYSN